MEIKNFSDGEIYVHYEESLRGCDVFVIQSTHPHGDNWIELLLMIDAAKRASANRVTAVIPYFGYARQERKDQPRVSIAAKLMANMLTTAGVDRVLTMDLHASQIQGFFDVPVDHLYGSAVFIEHFRAMNLDDLVVVAPDVGGIKMARAYAKRLNADLALIDKRASETKRCRGDAHHRRSGRQEHYSYRRHWSIRLGTLTSAANALRKEGALKIFAACTHPLLSGPAYQRLEDSALDALMITDTIPLDRPSDKLACCQRCGNFRRCDWTYLYGCIRVHTFCPVTGHRI